MPTLGTLGCADYDAFVLTRGGGSVVAQIPFTSLSWGRTLDDTSAASVTATVSPACAKILAQTRAWRHELAIFRSGRPVWAGPVYQPSSPVNQWQVQARDLTSWWDHRLIHFDHTYINTDLATIFQNIHDDAMSVDTSPGLDITTSASGIRAAVSILALQHILAGDKLRELTTTGIDWTVVYRTVLVGGVAVPTKPVGTFVDEHFAQAPTPTNDGTAAANAWLVRGAGGGTAGDAVYSYVKDGTAGKADGVLESVVSLPTIQDSASAKVAAASRLALTTDTTSIQNSVLVPGAPFDINDLVPGALARVVLAQVANPVFGDYRLSSVDVSVDASGEKVALTFQPVGTTSQEEANLLQAGLGTVNLNS